MRINKFVAQATSISRRSADQFILDKRITINDHLANLGDSVKENDQVSLDNKVLKQLKSKLVILNKPVGYVCSRVGQGNKTVYELLPRQYDNLKIVGRLDKDSSGLLILTNDGDLANELTHPKFNKYKEYRVKLNKPLKPQDQDRLNKGVELSDGISQLRLSKYEGADYDWFIRMSEGRNRQIRRSFGAVGYNVVKLDRISVGDYRLKNLPLGDYKELEGSNSGPVKL